MTSNNVVLVGFMATGKSTVGRSLAKRLSWQVVDTDDIVEEKAGKTISEIFAEQGEEAFRDLESEVSREVSKRSGYVIITGGGIVLREKNMQALRKAGPVFCLTADPETVLQRVQSTSHRPLLQNDDPLARIRSLLETRAPFYARADHCIDTSGKTVEEVEECILEILSGKYPEVMR